MTQVRNFVWLIVGIFHSCSVNLSQIAGKVLGEAKNESTVKRLNRFLANQAINVRSWYKPIAKAWLQAQFERVDEIRPDRRWHEDWFRPSTSDDLTGLSSPGCADCLGLAAQVRVKRQVNLLHAVKELLPSATAVFLVGDSEFGSIAVLRQLGQWHWFYVLRQKGNTGLWLRESTDWQRLESFVSRAGQSAWYPRLI